MRIYLASATGFSHEHSGYRERVKVRLRDLGHTVVDPWESDYSMLFNPGTMKTMDYEQRLAYNRWAGDFIARKNHNLLVGCDVVFGILDGTEPDSGTVSEVVFGVGLGKVGYGSAHRLARFR